MARPTVRDLLDAAPNLSRRQARRVRCWLYLPDGSAVGVDDALPVSSEWTRGTLRKADVRFRLAPPALLALHKPAGCITSRKPEAGAKTVFDVLGATPVAERVQPVGRLDRDTTGLLLLTSDGELLHRLTHPRRRVEREYIATVRGDVDPDGVARALRGELALRDGDVPHPARLEPIPTVEVSDEASWRIVLTEGRYHEVRRLFGALGARVTALHRTRYAGLMLGTPPCDLAPGEWTRLEGDAQRAVYESVSLEVPTPSLEIEWLAAPSDSEAD